MLKSLRGMACATLAASMLVAAPAFAQPPSRQDQAQDAESVAQAQRDARVVEEGNDGRAGVKRLVAMVPATPEETWVLTLSSGGEVRILLRPDVAPGHVARIKSLTRAGFYNGLTFHRVIDGFMAQGGDPLADGTGGSELPDLEAEFSWLPHMRGTVSMARAQGDNSANSQFFIMLTPRLQLDHDYTVIGRVVSGIAAVDQIPKGEPPENPARVVQAYIQSDGPNAAQLPAASIPSLPGSDAPAG